MDGINFHSSYEYVLILARPACGNNIGFLFFMKTRVMFFVLALLLTTFISKAQTETFTAMLELIESGHSDTIRGAMSQAGGSDQGLIAPPGGLRLLFQPFSWIFWRMP